MPDKYQMRATQLELHGNVAAARQPDPPEVLELAHRAHDAGSAVAQIELHHFVDVAADLVADAGADLQAAGGCHPRRTQLQIGVGDWPIGRAMAKKGNNAVLGTPW
ncbi:hypothetical protein [Xanthomonas cucurbitae]|uniref:hypothetical protein n=1 Tax=Xanthomonas cucurbitae TaxID=56453 RepID=UPI002368ED23|nr:hypothetical protein [Xanthomonas cucurbitae]